jgi:rubredoxin
VLGLRFFACEACGTVYAAPEEPGDCDRCSGGRLAELGDADRDGAAAYFAPVERDGSP